MKNTIITLTVTPQNESEREESLGAILNMMAALVSQDMLVSIHVNSFEDDEGPQGT
jgi:hypothetical protein